MTDIFAQEFQSLFCFVFLILLRKQQNTKTYYTQKSKDLVKIYIENRFKTFKKIRGKIRNMKTRVFVLFWIINCQQIPCDFSFHFYLRRNAINNDGWNSKASIERHYPGGT